MYQFIVPQVKKPLDGEVEISGAKNAVLAVMAAALLADGVSEITNVPHLKDMKTMSDVLRVIGCRISGEAHCLRIDTRGADHLEAPYELVKTMRASFYVLGPLVARFGRCRVSLPGGCAWGPRPVDLHLKGLEALGAKITLTRGYVEATCEGRLPGGTFHFPISSVGATVNVLMAATLAKGTSVLQNAALEPEIDNLVDFLVSMGAKIQGRGTRTLTVQGVEALRDMNCKVTVGPDWAEVDARGQELKPITIQTLPFPGYPTDMQAPLMATLLSVPGNSVIQDTVYNDRFKHVAEMERLGANITLSGNTATIKGGLPLEGAEVMGSDLRASAALVLAALIAEGETKISRIYHLDRGYEDFEAKMAKLGAEVQRVVIDADEP